MNARRALTILRAVAKAISLGEELEEADARDLAEVADWLESR